MSEIDSGEQLRQVTLSGAGELCLVTHPLEPLVGTTDVDLGTER